MAGGLTSASPRPHPLEQLLRSSGYEGSPTARPAADGGGSPGDTRDHVADDAALLLDALATEVPPAWTSGRFAARVEVARRHLVPITDPAVLAASFGREASNRIAAGRGSTIGFSAIRVAYGLRWLEITSGLRLPPWQSWIETSAPER